jgi:hypothetical protein
MHLIQRRSRKIKVVRIHMMRTMLRMPAMPGVSLTSIALAAPVPMVVFRHSKKLTRLGKPRRLTRVPPCMTRPCFLVIDREHSGSISTRKLVLESAKLNVITAYSGSEALETFARFPNIDGLVLNAAIHDVPCETVVGTIRAQAPNVPIIVIQGPSSQPCPGASHFVDSFDPASLLELVHKLFPSATASIKQQDDALKAEENHS